MEDALLPITEQCQGCKGTPWEKVNVTVPDKPDGNRQSRSIFRPFIALATANLASLEAVKDLLNSDKPGGQSSQFAKGWGVSKDAGLSMQKPGKSQANQMTWSPSPRDVWHSPHQKQTGSPAEVNHRALHLADLLVEFRNLNTLFFWRSLVVLNVDSEYPLDHLWTTLAKTHISGLLRDFSRGSKGQGLRVQTPLLPLTSGIA